ncbi:MAG: NUDIX hydrolase [Beijerinckiaceae bacterium]
MTIPVRHSARLIVLDPHDRLLLIQYQATRAFDPAHPERRGFWYTPGGGIDPGETPEQAALREIDEEMGIRGVPLGPLVATCQALRDRFSLVRFCHEQYFVMRTPSAHFDTSRLAETDIDPVSDVRWWDVPALMTTPESILPCGLPALAAQIIAGNVPATPVSLPAL